MTLGLGREALQVFYAFVDELSAERARALLWPRLDAAERERHDRFRFESDRHLYLVAHGLCRGVLGERLGLPPDQLRFEPREHGKPALASAHGVSGLCFNLSHTDGLVALAVARHEVGVDVERISRPTDLEQVARRVFSDTECADLMAHEGEARRRRFFDYWTLKEAYVKALGTGLSEPLTRISIDLAAPSPTVSGGPAPAWLASRAPSAEHVLSVALLGPAPEDASWSRWSPARGV